MTYFLVMVSLLGPGSYQHFNLETFDSFEACMSAMEHFKQGEFDSSTGFMCLTEGDG